MKSSIYFYFLFLLGMLVLNIFLYIDVPLQSELTVLTLLPSAILFFGFIFFKKIINLKNIDWFSVEIIFLVIFYLFHFGYLYLYILDIAEYDSEVFWNPSLVAKSIFYISICVNCFLIGFLIISPTTRYCFNYIKNINLKNIYFFSKILVIFSLLMFWLPIISILDRALSDYSVLISVGEESSIGKLYWIGQYIGVGSLAIYYLTKRELTNKLISDKFSYLPIFYILGYFIIGDRGGFLFYSIIPLVVYNSFYQRINVTKFLLYSLLILSASAVIAVSRVESIYNPLEAINSYSGSKSNNPIIEAVTEFGKSFKTIPIVMTYIPEPYDYWYGKSYFDAFLITFPNFIGNRKSESVGTWLTETAFGKDTYGRGGSIAMESYANFGVFGSIVFFTFLGSISAYLYRKFKYSENIYFCLLYTSYVSCLCLWMRNTSTVLFRTVIWSLMICFLISFISKKLSTRT